MGDSKRLLRKYTGRQMIYFVRRGNVAIREALRIAKKYRRNKLLIPDQGGWITYEQFAEKEGLEVDIIKTKDGVFGPEAIRGGRDTALLFNSLPAYSFNIDIDAISSVCHEKGILIINDATGSIGTPQGKKGDIILGSFSKGKPVPLGQGGFLASDVPLSLEETAEIESDELSSLLESLPERIEKISQAVEHMKEDLKDYDVVYPEHKGYNVIVAYSTDEEKETLIKMITEHGYEFTECPRDIRIKRKALSIEIKRTF